MKPIRINLIAPTAWVYGSEMALGVLDEAEGLPLWTIQLLRDGLTDRQGLARWLHANPSDGAIVLPRFSGCAKLVAKSCPATVTVCDDDRHDLARIGLDEEAIGHLAGRHLRSRGLTHFAYVRNAERWSPARERGFQRAAGGKAQVLPAGSGAAQRSHWLMTLPRPVGVFAGNDATAAQLLEDCLRLGLSIPHDLAVLGADDDRLLCLSTRPGLSSVRIPWRELGRRAVRALALTLGGRRPTAAVTPPLCVAVRPSTDLVSVADPVAARAIAFMRDQVGRCINVEDVIRELKCSRSQLERHLRTAIGHGPLAEIRRTRVERAVILLSQTGETIADIAISAGFPSQNSMHTAFKQQLHLTPLAYRAMTRSSSALSQEF